MSVEGVQAELSHIACDWFARAVLADDGLFGIELVVGAQDRATDVEDAADFGDSKRTQAVFDKASEAVFDTKNFKTTGECTHGDCANDSIETRAIAATGKHSDSTNL